MDSVGVGLLFHLVVVLNAWVGRSCFSPVMGVYQCVSGPLVTPRDPSEGLTGSLVSALSEGLTGPFLQPLSIATRSFEQLNRDLMS